jgi:hypothetical protein
MAAAAASSLLSGILADGLDGPGVVGEGLEGSDWFCAFTVGANASQEVAKTRIESLVDTCISNLRYDPGTTVIALTLRRSYSFLALAMI